MDGAGGLGQLSRRPSWEILGKFLATRVSPSTPSSPSSVSSPRTALREKLRKQFGILSRNVPFLMFEHPNSTPG